MGVRVLQAEEGAGAAGRITRHKSMAKNGCSRAPCWALSIVLGPLHRYVWATPSGSGQGWDRLGAVSTQTGRPEGAGANESDATVTSSDTLPNVAEGGG